MKIAVIYVDSLCFTIGHPNKILDGLGIPIRTEDNKKFLYQDKTEEELIKAADDLMNGILKRGEFTHYVGYIKGSNTVAYKRKYDPEYKNDRNKESPKWWSFVKSYLINSWGIIESNNIEVDDAVNIARLNIKNSYLCCIDSDLLGQEGTHYNWVKNEWITTTKEQEIYSFWSSIITGTHNNSKGLHKKGPKYVEKLFKESFNYKDSVLNAFIEHYDYDYKLAISEFHKNYYCVKTLKKYKGFELPKLIEVKSDKYNLVE